MSDTPTLPDDDALVGQLRAWADDLADRVPPTAAPTSPPRRAWGLPAAAAVVVVLGVAAVLLFVVGGPDGGGERVRAGTTTTTTTTTPDVPLLETTWILERVQEGDEDPVAAPDDSLWMYLTRASICAGADDCPRPDAFMVGTDGCHGYMATVTVTEDRLTAQPFGAVPLSACLPTPVNEVGYAASDIGRASSTYDIEGDVLTLVAGHRTRAVFRAEPGIPDPVPEGHPVLVGADDGPTYRWSWHEVSPRGSTEVALDVQTIGQDTDAGTIARLDPEAGPGSLAAALVVPGLVGGLVDGRATTVTYVRGDARVEMATRALAGQPDLAAFAGVVPADPSGWGLVATEADGAVVATFGEVPDRIVRGTYWVLVGLEVGGEVRDLPVAGLPTVAIAPCGQSDCTGEAISGYDGCNQYRGPVEVGADTLVIGDVVATQRGCDGPLDGWFRSVTTGEVGYDIAGDRLTLRAGGVVATFGPVGR